MKFSRPLSFLLVFVLIFSFFIVPSSAAHNLIESDLSKWGNITSTRPNNGAELYDMFCLKIVEGSYTTYQLQPSLVGDVNGTKFYYGYMFDKTVLKSGGSYTFEMHILSPSEIRNRTTFSWDDAGFASRLFGGYSIGFGVVNDSGQLTAVQEFVSITPDNYLSLAGTDFVHSFDCPNYSGGNPCIFIMASSSDAEATMFFDDSMFLTDNDAENEDGFFDRLFEWFQDKFDGIGNAFTDLGNRFTNVINSLSDSFRLVIDGLLDGINLTLTKFGNFLLYFSWSEEIPDNPFESEENSIDEIISAFNNSSGEIKEDDSFFVRSIKYLKSIGSDLIGLIDSVTAGIYVFDSFVDEFPWVKALILFSFALILFSRFVGL